MSPDIAEIILLLPLLEDITTFQCAARIHLLLLHSRFSILPLIYCILCPKQVLQLSRDHIKDILYKEEIIV